MASADLITAMVVIATGWLALSRALWRASRDDPDTVESAVIDNRYRGDFPRSSGPVNVRTGPPDLRAALDER
jgi:hypothetical protein